MQFNIVHVAYAEDHATLRKSLIIAVADERIVFDIEAADGAELIQKLETAACLPSVCIIDISMPRMNGFETIAEIKKRWPQLKVLVLSQYSLEHYIVRMIRLGANGYLLKDTDPSEIKTAVHTVHTEDFYYSEITPKKWCTAILRDQIRMYDLSEIEKLILQHCCSDLTYEEIGKLLKVSKRSVEGHRDNLFQKLKVHSRVGLVMFAIRFSLVLPEYTNLA